VHIAECTVTLTCMGETLHEEATPLLTVEELAKLESLGYTIRRSAGDPFFLEGEHTDFALLIRKGHVKIMAGKPPRTVAIRHAGEIVGEMAAVRKKPRSASVIAFDEVDALFIPATTWRQFLLDNPRAMYAQLVASEERLDQATRKIVESDLAVEQRLARALVELIGNDLGVQSEEGIVLRLSQHDLAALIGASKLDSVKKIIRTFKARDIVATGRQVIAVRDFAALRDIANGAMTATS
jgi:CRP/FNR family cyclic AMP-dependent transcriptional regulator